MVAICYCFTSHLVLNSFRQSLNFPVTEKVITEESTRCSMVFHHSFYLVDVIVHHENMGSKEVLLLSWYSVLSLVVLVICQIVVLGKIRYVFLSLAPLLSSILSNLYLEEQ